MSLRIEFDDDFATDLRDALAYYRDEAGEKTEDEFFNEFERIVAVLSENPRRFPFYRRNIRRTNFRKFPYHLLYEIELDSVRVYSLRHDHRHPDHGLDRL